jgi:hypothetical protein
MYYETCWAAVDAVEDILRAAGFDLKVIEYMPPTATLGDYRLNHNLREGGLWIHIQLHRMESGRYELNAYISKESKRRSA